MKKQFFDNYALSMIRIITGYIFFLHGMAKIFHLPQSSYALDSLNSLMGVSAFFELIGGALLIIGLGTKWVAFILSGMMAYAYFFIHAKSNNILLPLLNGGDGAILFSFIFIIFFFLGGGKISLDYLIKQRKDD